MLVDQAGRHSQTRSQKSQTPIPQQLSNGSTGEQGLLSKQNVVGLTEADGGEEGEQVALILSMTVYALYRSNLTRVDMK